MFSANKKNFLSGKLEQRQNNNNHHHHHHHHCVVRRWEWREKNLAQKTISYLLCLMHPKTQTFKWRLLKCKDLFCMNNKDAERNKLVITKNNATHFQHTKKGFFDSNIQKTDCNEQFKKEKKTSHLFSNLFLIKKKWGKEMFQSWTTAYRRKKRNN